MHTKRPFGRTATALIVAGGLALGTAAPGGTSHAWRGAHWRHGRGPTVVGLGDNLAGDWDRALAETAVDWTADDGKRDVVDVSVVTGRAGDERCRATPGRVEICHGAYGETGWLGTTTIWTNGRHIGQATVRLNDTYLATPDAAGAPLPLLDPVFPADPTGRRSVLCQEIGHALGLDHAGGASCMNDDGHPADPAYVDPNGHDHDQLVASYSHNDKKGRGGKKGQARQKGKASGEARRPSGATIEADLFPPALDGLPATGGALVEPLGGDRFRITFVTPLPR